MTKRTVSASTAQNAEAAGVRNGVVGFHNPDEPNGLFSNWAATPFAYAGVHYPTSEHYMMVQKVLLGGRFDLAEKILANPDPAKAKKFAGKECYPEYALIRGYWERFREHIVKRGIKAKLRQNPEAFRCLMETGDLLLAECAGNDKIWGIGVRMASTRWGDTANWQGENLLGRILMQLRTELGAEYKLRGTIAYQPREEARPEEEPYLTIPLQRLIKDPAYHKALHLYEDSLPEAAKESFKASTLDVWERSCLPGMANEACRAGLADLLQELYEIAAYRRLTQL